MVAVCACVCSKGNFRKICGQIFGCVTAKSDQWENWKLKNINRYPEGFVIFLIFAFNIADNRRHFECREKGGSAIFERDPGCDYITGVVM